MRLFSFILPLLMVLAAVMFSMAPAIATEVEAESYRYGRLRAMRTQHQPHHRPVYHSLFQQRASTFQRNHLYGTPAPATPAPAPVAAPPTAATPVAQPKPTTPPSASPVSPPTPSTSSSTASTPASTPAPQNNPSPQQPIIIREGKSESGWDLFLKYLPFIILFLSIAIIALLIFIFRDKIPACVAACEVCCEWTWRIVLWPFKMLWRAFKFCFYPIKESCVECYTSCYDCFNPSQVKI